MSIDKVSISSTTELFVVQDARKKMPKKFHGFKFESKLGFANAPPCLLN
jgi:hypothetical protein